MIDHLRPATINAVQNLHDDATDISLPENLSELTHGFPVNLHLTWKSNGDLNIGQVLAWTGPASNSHEVRVLEAMSHTEIPVPDLLTAGTDGSISVMLGNQVEGRSIAESLENVGMRWEISTIAFAFARILARIHALDWTKVTPWLADPESLPEDILDDQVEEEFEWRETQSEQVPAEWQPFLKRVIDWLELRRPVEASLCLCHGQFHPGNIFAMGEDVTAVVNWQQANVTDASRDLAMLPVWLNDIGLSVEDVELFAQAVQGAYLQASPRALANTAYYSVAQPLDQLIERLIDQTSPASEEELTTLQGTIERAIALAGRVPWKNR